MLMAKKIIITVATISPLMAFGATDEINTSQVAVAAFLKEPNVKILYSPDPTKWKSHRKYIQTGTKTPDGGCKFSSETKSNTLARLVQTEIAVDRLTCRSLILEGEPDDDSWRVLQHILERLKTKDRSATKSVPSL